MRKYVRADVPPGYVRKGGGNVLDPYKDRLKARLASHPLSAARLYREIGEKGYALKFSPIVGRGRTDSMFFK